MSGCLLSPVASYLCPVAPTVVCLKTTKSFDAFISNASQIFLIIFDHNIVQAVLTKIRKKICDKPDLVEHAPNVRSLCSCCSGLDLIPTCGLCRTSPPPPSPPTVSSCQIKSKKEMKKNQGPLSCFY